MNSIKSQIPNLLTLSNLLCGCLAIKYAFEWDLVMAAYLVGLAAVFDFFDGFAARLLKVSGEMGKQLDSLADMVSFGVVPGVVMFQMMRIVSYERNYKDENHHWGQSEIVDLNDFTSPFCYLAFLIAILSAYRLAKFNIDTRQSDKFIGLPTPANAIFICSIGILFSWNVGFEVKETLQWNNLYYVGMYAQFDQPGEPFHLYNHAANLVVENSSTIRLSDYISRNNLFLTLGLTTLIFSFLLISELPLFALKFKNFGWSDNKIRYVFLSISAAMLIIFHLLAIPFIVILYIVLSVVNNFIFKQ